MYNYSVDIRFYTFNIQKTEVKLYNIHDVMISNITVIDLYTDTES